MFFPRYNPVEVRPRHEFLFWSTAVFMLLLFLGRNALWGLEGRNAEIVREMLLTGNIFTPQLNGVVQSSRMPLGFWVVLPGTLLFGTDEFMLRLPTVLSALVLLWATGKITEKLFDIQTSLIARWVLLGTYGFVFWARVVAPDMANAAATACAAACFFYWKDEPDFRDYFCFYFLLGTGSLFKGVPMVAVAFLLLLPCALVRRKFSKYCNWRHFAAVALAVAAAIPYLVCYSGGVADNAIDLLWQKQIFRLLDAKNSSEPFYCYIYHLPRILLPWSVIFLAGFVAFFIRRKELNPEFSALLTGMVLVFTLFSFSGSRSWYYLLPLVPFCAIVTAAVLSGYAAETKIIDWLLVVMYFVLLIFISLAVALPVALPLQGIIFKYHIPGSVIAFGFVAGFVVAVLLIFDRGEDNFVSRMFGMAPEIASLTAGTAIAVTTLFCAVIPMFTVFRTEKPFMLELRDQLEGISPSRIFFYTNSVHARALFYLAQEHPVMYGKNIDPFIRLNSGGRVAVISEDDPENRKELKTQLAFLPETVFDVDKPHLQEHRLNHESEKKEKYRAWIFDVPSLNDLKREK